MKSTSGVARRVVFYGNPVLRTKASMVTDITADVRRLLADLKRMVVSEDGLGLAANQIAVPLQVFAINPAGADAGNRPYCIINPTVVATEGSVEREEGCLSIPDVYDVVSRPELVRIAGIDEEGRSVEMEATGLLARAFMHETDHLNGVLFIDMLGEVRRRLMADRLRKIEARELRLSRERQSQTAESE